MDCVSIERERGTVKTLRELGLLTLAVDTTTKSGGLALARDTQILEEQPGDETRTHGEQLPGTLRALLARHDLTTTEIDRFAVALGPGSFTGLRVGIATVQGLALAHGRAVVGLSVLDTLVEVGARLTANSDRPDIIVPWVDAKRGQVFSAMYRPEEVAEVEASETDNVALGQRWRLAVDAVAMEPAALLNGWADYLAHQRVLVIGDAVGSHRSFLETRLTPGFRLVLDPPLLAGVMATMAACEPWRSRATTPHALRPVYVRRPDAELARNRRRGVGGP